MAVLILGLALFLGIHLVPALPALRDALYKRHGEKRYKSAFSLVSALGLVLIVAGYAHASATPQLFAPYPAAIAAAPFAMAISFVLLAAANMKTHLRHALKHPMLIGIGIWATIHLLVNGSTRATVLFGAFLAYAVIDLASAMARHAARGFKPVACQDLIAVVSGIVLALLVMSIHRWLFGVRVVPWGV